MSSSLTLYFRTNNYVQQIQYDLSDYQYVNSDYDDDVTETSISPTKELSAPVQSGSPQIAVNTVPKKDNLSVEK